MNYVENSSDEWKDTCSSDSYLSLARQLRAQLEDEAFSSIIIPVWDVAQTKDSVLVLIHDNSLDRTTTGTGKLTNYTYKQLQQFNLVDDFGTETNFKIPRLKDVLLFAKQNNIVFMCSILVSDPYSFQTILKRM